MTPAAGYGWTRLRRCEPARLFPAVWVEISGRQLWDSLPFRLIFVFWVEISGRGLRDSLPFWLIFAVWVEISNRRHWEFLPFRPIFVIWVEISDKLVRDSLPFSTDFRCLGRDFLARAFSPWHRVSCHDTGFPPGHGTPGGNPMAHTYIRHSNYINGSTFRHDQAEARATTLHTKKTSVHIP